jgi:hypothetical protein
MKRVFIIHGWGGYPKEGWFPWLKKELEKKGFKVEVPAMPETAYPKINAWVSHLKKIVGAADEETFFVGHSIGCQTILRYLETIKSKKIGGAVLVAGWVHLTAAALETEEEKKIAKPWLETPIGWNEIKKHRFAAIFSDNDPLIPLSDSKIFKSKLGAKIIIEKNKKHFSGSDNITELKSALDELLAISSQLS